LEDKFAEDLKDTYSGSIYLGNCEAFVDEDKDLIIETRIY